MSNGGWLGLLGWLIALGLGYLLVRYGGKYRGPR